MRQSLVGIHHVQRIVRRCVFALDLARIDHAQARAVSGNDESGVAGLSTADRIKNGAVELDTVIADARDDRVALAYGKRPRETAPALSLATIMLYGLVGRFSVVHSGMPPRSQ